MKHRVNVPSRCYFLFNIHILYTKNEKYKDNIDGIILL